jgi:predicted nucleic acid-binding protein
MIVLDANLLLYAYDRTSACHPKARRWIENIFSGDMLVGLPWQSVIAFWRGLVQCRFAGRSVHSR